MVGSFAMLSMARRPVGLRMAIPTLHSVTSECFKVHSALYHSWHKPCIDFHLMHSLAHIRPQAHDRRDATPYTSSKSSLALAVMSLGSKGTDVSRSSPGTGSSPTVHEQGFELPYTPNGETITPRRIPRKRRFIMRSLCSLPMLLHLGVLAIYIALCVIWSQRVERRWEISLDYSVFFQGLNIVSHFIMLVFSISITATMQRVATHAAFRDLPQSLTMLSDKMVAWNSLGSALVNLYHNIRRPAALSQVFLITSYFAALSGLGLTSSYLFVFPTINGTDSQYTATTVLTLGSVPVEALLPPSISNTPSNFSSIRFDWYMASMALQSRFYVNEESLPGMDPNRSRIFDGVTELLDPYYTGHANVSYTDFHAKCGSVPGISIAAFALDSPASQTSPTSVDGLPTALAINYTLGPYSLSLFDSMNISTSNASTTIHGLWQPSDILIRVPSSPIMADMGRNVVLYNIYDDADRSYGSRPIVDADGNKGSLWPLNVQLRDGTTLPTGLIVQVIGCSLSTTNGTAVLDVTRNRLIDQDYYAPYNASTSVWGEWSPDLNSSTALEDMWASMFLTGNSVPLWRDQLNPPDNAQWSCLNLVPMGSNSTISSGDLQGMSEYCHVPTIMESYLTMGTFGGDGPNSIIPLGWLEDALASATALMVWSAGAVDNTLTTYTTQPPITSRTVQTTLSNVTVNYHWLVGRVDFRVPLLLLGTALAVILTALAAYILGSTEVSEDGAPLDDVKLLSLMTLNNSAVVSRLRKHKTDTTQARREAGLFPVKVVGHQFVPANGTETEHDEDTSQEVLLARFNEEEEKGMGTL
ncbi:unnamed protein product [Peniophora sp. CBMAI 1063]|nr:unnamed protein product [Peniophora sp. CBMAI 1063]